MKKLTWEDIDGKILDCTLGRLMDQIEEETGKFPEWTDFIPDYILDILQM